MNKKGDKYITLGIVGVFWLLVPFIAQIAGVTQFSYAIANDFTSGVAKPEGIEIINAFVNWIGFYFRALTFSLPNAPLFIGIFIWILLIVTVLSIVSLFRGD